MRPSRWRRRAGTARSARHLPRGERSPYGFELGITYPHADPAALFRAARAALSGWRDVGPRDRAVVCAEFLARINARSHEFAQVAMHTSGHNFLMAFHAGAVHAQDRGLEAVAVALREQTRLPARRRWDKPYGDRTLSVDKTFTVVPRGVSLLIGNRVVPTWSGYPGLFASLATGNSSGARRLRSTRPSVLAASSHRHTVRTFTPPTWAPACTCAVVNAPAASSSSNRATSTGLDTPSPAVPSPHAPGSPTPHPPARACRSGTRQGSGPGRPASGPISGVVPKRWPPCRTVRGACRTGRVRGGRRTVPGGGLAITNPVTRSTGSSGGADVTGRAVRGKPYARA